MALDYGWVTKTQQAIGDAIVSGKLTNWELNFLQSISTKLDKYTTDSRISDKQQSKLLSVLRRFEKPKTESLLPTPINLVPAANRILLDLRATGCDPRQDENERHETFVLRPGRNRTYLIYKMTRVSRSTRSPERPMPWCPPDSYHLRKVSPCRILRQQVVLTELRVQAETDQAGAAVTEFRASHHDELEAAGD
jgi:hypothetical protein